jgi:hypothetical protein
MITSTNPTKLINPPIPLSPIAPNERTNTLPSDGPINIALGQTALIRTR